MRCLAAVPLLDAGGNILAVVSWIRWVTDVVVEKCCFFQFFVFFLMFFCVCVCFFEEKLREAN